MEIGNKKGTLVILSIAIVICLSVIAFSSMTVADSVIIQDTNDDFLITPILPTERIEPNSGTRSFGSSTAINNGALYLIHAQADVTEDNAQNNPEVDPDDGGWDWVLTSPTFTHSAAASPTNIYGATALGLYYSYMATQMNSITPNTRYMIAMTDAANKMVAGGTASIRSASDLIYLMLYDDLPSVCGTTYQASAKAKYDARIAAYGSAQAFAEYIRNARCASYPNGIIAWDIGLWVKVAAMLDERYGGTYSADAVAMAEVIYQDSYNNNPGCFDIIGDQGFIADYSNVNYWWYTLGITGLIEAFNAAQVHTTEIPGLLLILDACQYPSGAYSYCYGANLNDEDWQSTAYAVMALGNLNAYTYRNEIALAVSWLESTQDPASGGWVYSDGSHYPEVCGENLAALYFDGPVYNTNTGEVFWSIEAAQDDKNTLNGHTILVEPGTYKGNIIVYKQVIIQSEEECEAIIDADQLDVCNYRNSYCKGINYAWAQAHDPGLLDNGFLVFVDNVIIDGFNIINANYYDYNRGIGILIGTISSTYCSWCPWNIDQWGGTVPNPTYAHPTNVIIRNNCIVGASDGIYNWASNGNTIEYNTITNSVTLGGMGIQCYEGGTNNIIRGNTMNNIVGAGISICGAWPNYLLDCSNTLIYDNTVTNSNWGIQFYNMGGSGVKAYHNNLLNNNRGIVVEGVGDATVGTAYENNIQGNTQYGIINTCPTGIFIASCNWWNHISGPSGVAGGLGDPVSTNVKYCLWLNAAYPGGVCIGGAVCWNQMTGIYYCSIQSAIDDPLTDAGDVIEVFALTQVEKITIHKSVTLIGQGIGSTILKSTVFPVITVSANNVFIRDLTVTDDIQLVEGVRVVSPASTGLTIERVAFTNLGATGSANAYGIQIMNSFSGLTVNDCDFIAKIHTTYLRAIGIFAGNNYILNNFKVFDSTFERLFVGIYLRSTINSLEANGNTFGPQQISDCTAAVAGIYIGDGSDYNFDIQNIKVVDNTFTSFGRGVYIWNYANDEIIGTFKIYGNTFTDSLWSSPIRFIAGNAGDENVAYSGPINIYQNTFTQNAELTPGANVALIEFRSYCEHPTCNIAITDNKITFSGTYTHAKYGIKFTSWADAFTNVLVEGNILEGNNVLDGKTGTIPSSAIVIDHYSSTEWPTDVFGIDIMHNNLTGFDNGFCIYDLDNSQYGGLPTVNDVHINFNNICDNVNGIRNDNPALIDAECNWYGDILGPTHPSNIYGIGDSVSDNVDYIPWLNLPFEHPDSICAMGVCQDIVYVDDDYKPDEPGYFIDHFPTIQMALDRLESGGTAIIYDGEYDEDLIIDDFPCDNTGITIMGEYECFPTTESAVIQGHAIISVNDVTIKYLEFKPTTDAAITVEAGVSGTTLEFNKFRRDCITDAIGVQALDNAIVDAEANWWGAQDGPNGGMMDDGKTSDGNGVKLIGEVLVEPWIGIHAEIAEPTGTMEVELGTPVTFDATGSFAYSFGECCELTEIPMQYLWDFGDGLQSSNMIATHVFEQAGTYLVTLMVDSFGIPDLYSNFMYDWAYVTVHVVTEDTTLTANADGGNLGGYETIVDEPIQLYGDAYGGNGEYTWHWNFGDQTADSNMQNPIHTYTEPGVYTATLTVISAGETATDTAQVRVYDIDELFVTINDANAIAGVETMFAASIKGGTSPYTVSWDFGDQTTSQENRPTHIYNNPGVYTVTVTVIDDKQKTATDTATINVEEENIIEEAEIKEVKAGLGVKAVIDAGENNCHWEITVEGKVFLGGENSGTIDANTQETVKLGFSLAFGEVNIVVKAAGMQKEYTAFALGPLYFNLQEV